MPQLNVGLPNGKVLFPQNFDNAADAFAAYLTVKAIKGTRIVVLKDSIPEVTLKVTSDVKVRKVAVGKRALPGSDYVDRKRAGVCSPSTWGWGK